MHEVLVNRLGGLSLPRKSVVRLSARPDMTLDVYRGRKTTNQQQQCPLENDHDISQLCRTGHDNVSRTRMATLAFILSKLFPLIVSDTISCLLHNLKTVLTVLMIHIVT